MKPEYKSIIVELAGQVATVRIRHPKMPGGDIHWDLGEVSSVINRHVVEQVNRTVDAGAGYEMVSFL